MSVDAVVPESGGSLREDLEHVLAEANATPDEAQEAPSRGLTEDAPILPDETPEQKAERARDESGRFAKEPKPKPAAKDVKPAPVVELKPKLEAVPKPAEPVKAEPSKPVTPTIKPPASWRPEVREKWAALPPEVQQEVARREREVAVTLQQAAPLKQELEAWQRTLAPHAGMLQAFGGDPRRTIGEVLQAQAVLHYGSPKQKAGLLARLITGYNVSIDDLAGELNGTSPVPQQQSPQQFRDPRFDQFLAQAQQFRAQRDAAAKQEAVATWTAFAEKHEYAEELKPLIGSYLGDGHAPDLETAYDMALHAHPEYRKVVLQRAAAETATAQHAATQEKKSAAVSLKSVPGGTPELDGAGSDGSVGGDLRAMYRRMAK